MLAGALIGLIATFLLAPRDPFAWENLQIALLATAIGIGVMGLWHLIRAPWVLQRRTASNQSEDEPWAWGIFGVVIICGILFGTYYGFMRAYRAKIPELTVTFPSADPGAANAEIVRRLTTEIAELKGKKPQVITRNVSVPVGEDAAELVRIQKEEKARREKRMAIRLVLAKFISEGQAIQVALSYNEKPTYEDFVNATQQWSDKCAAQLRKDLGEDYVVMFSSPAGLNSYSPNKTPPEPHSNDKDTLWNRVNFRIIRLNQFIQELKP